MKLALLLRQASIKKGIFKDVNIGVASGECYRGMLLNKHRSTFRVIGTCFQLAGRIAMSEESAQNILIAEDTIQAYAQLSANSMFTKLDVEIPLYSFLPRSGEQSTSSIATFEINSPIMSKNLMSFTRTFSNEAEKLSSRQKQRRMSLDQTRTHQIWKLMVKNFTEKRSPRLVIVEGREGAFVCFRVFKDAFD